MRIIDITHPPQSLWIGREGENTFRPVSFECANWFSAYPNATIAAYYQPYGASDPYPLVLTVDGTKRIWHPLLAELVKGDGELQIVLMQGDTVGTSAIIPTKVDRSLISSADHPASETPAWPVKVVRDVTEQADRAEAAVSHYPQIRNDYWWVWDAENGEWVNTGVKATGEGGSATVVVTIDDTTDPMTASMTAAEIKAAADRGDRVVLSIGGFEIPYLTNFGQTAVFSKVVDVDSPVPVCITLLIAQNGRVTATSTQLAIRADVPTTEQIANAAPVQSVNGQTGAVVLDASDVGALPSNTPIPAAVTERTVAGWGFTKNTGTYSKPSGGIPASDLADGVIPAVPTKTSDLQNDSGYQTSAQVQTKISTATANKAEKTLRVAMTAQDTTAALEPNRLYVFPDMSALTITLAAPADSTVVNEYHFIFGSGATATTLTIPATINQPDGFTVEANHVYEVSILEGCMTAQGWAVSA